MLIGANLMTRGAGAGAAGIEAMARKTEAIGLDYIAVNDHVVVPRGIESRYPYSDDGAWAGAAAGECLEQLSVLSFLAAVTERVRLLTSVMVLPHRPAVLSAKMLATADRLSRGRITVGCGAGWLREEFEALGAPPYAERGRVTDEYIAAFRALWTEDDPAMDGRHVRFGDVLFRPRPVQEPHPPIWIGGESPQALRRAARYGDGWYPASGNPAHLMNDLDRVEQGVARFRNACSDLGRDPATLDIGLFAIEPVEAEARRRADGSRQLLSGEPADIAADLAGLGECGVGHLVVMLQKPDLAETIERMDWFSTEVLPLVRA